MPRPPENTVRREFFDSETCGSTRSSMRDSRRRNRWKKTSCAREKRSRGPTMWLGSTRCGGARHPPCSRASSTARSSLAGRSMLARAVAPRVCWREEAHASSSPWTRQDGSIACSTALRLDAPWTEQHFGTPASPRSRPACFRRCCTPALRFVRGGSNAQRGMVATTRGALRDGPEARRERGPTRPCRSRTRRSCRRPPPRSPPARGSRPGTAS